jgi:hypothetical protein
VCLVGLVGEAGRQTEDGVQVVGVDGKAPLQSSNGGDVLLILGLKGSAG